MPNELLSMPCKAVFYEGKTPLLAATVARFPVKGEGFRFEGPRIYEVQQMYFDVANETLRVFVTERVNVPAVDVQPGA